MNTCVVAAGYADLVNAAGFAKSGLPAICVPKEEEKGCLAPQF
jgi:UDP-glucose 6-dehydrogenase